MGGAEKRGGETKILKKGEGKLGQGVGALKRGGGDLQTMMCRYRVNQHLHLYIASVSKVLVTEFIAVKVSQDLHLM